MLDINNTNNKVNFLYAIGAVSYLGLYAWF